MSAAVVMSPLTQTRGSGPSPIRTWSTLEGCLDLVGSSSKGTGGEKNSLLRNIIIYSSQAGFLQKLLKFTGISV